MNGASARPPAIARYRSTTSEDNIYAGYYYKYMIVVASLGYSWVYLNAGSILSSGSAEGINVASTAILMGVSTSYLVYGYLRKDSIIVLSSIISLIGNLFLLTSVFIVTST